MENDFREILSAYITDPPDDLVDFYQSPAVLPGGLDDRFLGLDEAIRYTQAIRQRTLIGEAMGLFALDDVNDSNPYCYISRGPVRGGILHLHHDDDSNIAYASLAALLDALASDIDDDGQTRDLHTPSQIAVDQDVLCERIAEVAQTATEAAESELVVLIGVLDTGRTEVIRSLAKHSSFFVREAIAALISKFPRIELRSDAELLAADAYPQVARPGKAASAAISRLQNAK